MNLKDTVLAIINSPHTSIPGALILVSSLGEIWLPQYQAQFHKTREFAMGYGLLMAPQVIAKNGQAKSAESDKSNSISSGPTP